MQELQNIALNQITKAIEGNGVDVKDICVEKFDVQTHAFVALTRLTLESETTTSTKGGQIGGSAIFPSASAVQSAIKTDLEALVNNPTTVEQIKSTILSREDKGVGLSETAIPLPNLNKDYITHEQCKTCAGKANLKCQKCHGSARQPCPRCHGRGTDICPTCGGRKYIDAGSGANNLCVRCNGDGRVHCTQCQQSKTVPCQACNGKGIEQCHACEGQGWSSHITSVQIKAIAHFEFDHAHLPTDLAAYIENIKHNLNEHAKVEILQSPPAPAQGEDQPSQKFIRIDYGLKLPLGHAVFKIKNLEIPVMIVGKHAKIENAPPFLEKIISKGIKSLRSAAMGQGDITAHLKQAGKYRTLQSIIHASASHKPAEALRIIMQENPLGLSEINVEKLIRMAHAALRHINKRPRMIGYAIGVAAALTIIVAYYTALQPIVQSIMPNASFAAGVGVFAILTALGAGYFIANKYAKTATKKILQNIFNQS